MAPTLLQPVRTAPAPGVTRVRLMEVAADLFYRHGFQAVGLDRILREVGITKTGFYKHFASKDDLILALLEHRDAQDVAQVEAYVAARGGTAAEKLLAFFDFLAEWFAEPDFHGCLFLNAGTEFPSPAHPIHEAAARHAEGVASSLRAFAAEAGCAEPGALATQLLLLALGAIAARHAGGTADAAGQARAAAEVLVRRACAQPARAASAVG